jgi:hypothetical protein
MVTLRALKLGAVIDNAVLLNSPLSAAGAKTEIPPILANVRVKIYNYFTNWDLVTGNVAMGGAKKWDVVNNKVLV